MHVPCPKFGLLAVLALCGTAAAQAASDEPGVDLTPNTPAGLVQTVTTELQFGGDLLVEQGTDGLQRSQMPVSATATLVYDEVRLPHRDRCSVRHYREVAGETEVAGRRQSLTLRESRRLVLAEFEGQSCRFSVNDGVLDRSELDLLDTAANSLVLDELLPQREVQAGDSWQLEAAPMQALTGLDSVGLCEVSAVLAEANDRFARCQLAGAVHGVLHGASVELEIDAVYLFDRHRKQVTQLNIALRENREIGPATPGVDAVAKLRVKIEPAASDSQLAPEVVARVAEAAATGLRLVETRSQQLGFATRHDDRWYTAGTRGGEMTVRRVVPEGLVAHGNIATLVAKPLEPDTALADFRRDVLLSLGKDAHGVAREEQWTNEHGCLVMGVVVAGAVNGAEIEWHAYQVAPPVDSQQLHRLALTFTVEKAEVERLGSHARDLVDQLELFPIAQLQARRPNSQK